MRNDRGSKNNGDLRDRHVLGHKLGNLLTPVSGMAHLLSVKAQISGDAEVQRLSSTIYAAARAASRLLEMYVLLRDIESGTRPLRSRPGQLELLLGSLTRDLEQEAHDAGATLEIAVAGSRRVMMDYDLLPPVFINLLSGAIRYVSKECGPTERTILITVGSDRDEVMVTLAYGSAPLDRQQTSRFFEPFADPWADSADGTGLENAHSRAVVDAHGGRISVGGSSSGGIAVTIVLPAVGAERDEPMEVER